MFTQEKPRAALIVDHNIKFLEEVLADPQAQDSPPYVARTGKEAQKILADNKIQLAGVFVNPDITTPERGPGGVSVIRFSRQARPTTPVYAICDQGCSHSADDLRALGVRDVLEKPILYKSILELVAPQVIKFDLKAIAAENKNQDKIGAETVAGDELFVPIRAKDFISGAVSYFNIYVRLGSGRYLKLLNAGDSFSPDRLAGYLQKGTEHFYLRTEDQQLYLNYCNELASKAAGSAKVSLNVKLSQAMNYGQETLNFLRNQGLSETNLYHASNFVENLHGLVGKMNLGKVDALQGFLTDIESYEHGVSTSMITSLLSSVTGIESSSVVQIVGIASLMHDVGLYCMPEEVRTEDESKMTDQQKELFCTHPKVGAEMMEAVSGTHPTVVQAILQHHERRGKKSFAGGIKPKTLNRIGEIIGIADEYLRLVKKSKADPTVNIKQAMETEIFNSFSPHVVEAFRGVFCKLK